MSLPPTKPATDSEASLLVLGILKSRYSYKYVREQHNEIILRLLVRCQQLSGSNRIQQHVRCRAVYCLERDTSELTQAISKDERGPQTSIVLLESHLIQHSY
jgi:hypothetical protein